MILHDGIALSVILQWNGITLFVINWEEGIVFILNLFWKFGSVPCICPMLSKTILANMNAKVRPLMHRISTTLNDLRSCALNLNFFMSDVLEPSYQFTCWSSHANSCQILLSVSFFNPSTPPNHFPCHATCTNFAICIGRAGNRIFFFLAPFLANGLVWSGWSCFTGQFPGIASVLLPWCPGNPKAAKGGAGTRPTGKAGASMASTVGAWGTLVYG